VSRFNAFINLEPVQTTKIYNVEEIEKLYIRFFIKNINAINVFSLVIGLLCKPGP